MGDKSKIEWCDASINPIRARCGERVGWHCEHVSEGCRNCYSEGMNKRLGTGRPFKPGELRNGVKLFLDEKMLMQPLRWKKPRHIFVCSMTDLFADFVPDEMIAKVFAVMALCPQHTFQILTKRPERMRRYLEHDWYKVTQDICEEITAIADGVIIADAGLAVYRHVRDATGMWPLPNVWLGTSVEDQDAADKRVPELLATPAAMRFVSVEPMLGPVNLGWLDYGGHQRLNALSGVAVWDDGTYHDEGYAHLDWVICGTESGPGARDCDLGHVRSLRDQCLGAGVPFFLKQLKIDGKLVKMPELDGKVWSEMP